MGRSVVRSKAAQPPSEFCMARSQLTARRTEGAAGSPPSRERDMATMAGPRGSGGGGLANSKNQLEVSARSAWGQFRTQSAGPRHSLERSQRTAAMMGEDWGSM